MKLKRCLFSLTIPLILAACNQGTVTPVSDISKPDRSLALLKEITGPTRWFVELKSDPTAVDASVIRREQEQFKDVTKDIQYETVYQYDKLFNGFSVIASDEAMRQIAALDNVLRIYPVTTLVAPPQPDPETNDNTPEMFYANSITGVDEIREKYKVTGKGIKVGVIDTGIASDHPAFRGRIAKWKDFSKKDKGSSSPEDCDGHGTHVAGIIGGDDSLTQSVDGKKFTGVAPGVEFGVYRVFPCKEGEGSPDDAVVKALEQAYDDGMRVINLSLGIPLNNWAQTPDAIAANRLVKKGIVVIASAGNSGRNGSFSMGGVTMGEGVISVASVDNIKQDVPAYEVKTSGTKEMQAYLVPSESINPKENFEYLLTKSKHSNTAATADGCDASKSFEGENDIQGKAVLIRRGGCTFVEKIANAEKAGAALVVIYNNKPDEGAVGMDIEKGTKVPVVGISAQDGVRLDALLSQKQEVKLNFNKNIRTTVDIGNATNLSDFTSYGLSAELELKPDIAAPGGKIYSAAPYKNDNSSGYQYLSGTSMAAPHVAGAVALLLERYPYLKPNDVRTLIMNSASLRHYPKSNGSQVDYVERQGAGLLDLRNAFNIMESRKISINPPKLSLGSSHDFPVRKKVLVVSNDSNDEVTYLVKHVPARTVTGSTFSPVPMDVFASMKVNDENVDQEGIKITIPRGGKAELNLEITPPANAPDGSQYGGYVKLTSMGLPELSVPYGGYKGNYLDLPSFGKLIEENRVKKTQSLLATPIFVDTKEGIRIMRDHVANAQEIYTYWKKGEIDFDFKEHPVLDENQQPRKDKDGKPIVFIDQPILRINRIQQIRKFTIEAVNEDGKVYPYFQSEFLSRHCTNDLSKVTDSCRAYSSLAWDGTYKTSGMKEYTNVPPGNYFLRIKALKPTGKEGQLGHEELYESPKFKVIR